MLENPPQNAIPEQWGKQEEQTTENRQPEHNHTEQEHTFEAPTKPEEYNTEPPTLAELNQIIKKLKRRKAPGPDGIPTELIKELSKEDPKRYPKFTNKNSELQT